MGNDLNYFKLIFTLRRIYKTYEFVIHVYSTKIKMLNTDYLLRSLIREGSLMLHACCDTRPRFFRSHTKDHIRFIALHDRGGICPDVTKNITGRVHSNLISCEQVVLWGLSKLSF